MKKIILLAALALLSIALLAQEQEQVPVQNPEPPQLQAEEPVSSPPQGLPEGRDLKTVRIAQAFIHAGKEYPPGTYRMVLGEKDGQYVFFVANAQKELLFEDLAIVKAHPPEGTKSHFHVNIAGMSDKEYIRIKVTTQGEWFLGYFLVKK
jgi:hypothetical protein